MGKVAGTLLGGMERLRSQGRKVGVVVIDEQGNLRKDFSPRDQLRVLAFATSNAYPVWPVETNARPDAKANNPTKVRLRGYLPHGTQVITRQHFDAFTGTDLHEVLQVSEIDAFVVMGYETNCCVRQTTTGGGGSTGKDYQPGANALGYLILTCPQILHGTEPSLVDASAVSRKSVAVANLS